MPKSKACSFVIFLLVLSWPALGQDAAQCRADLVRFYPPVKAWVDDVMPTGITPVKFLFSQNGVDAYSAADVKTNASLAKYHMLTSIPAITVLLVYQDERARQKKVQDLLSPWANAPQRGASEQAVERTKWKFRNVKYATWKFQLAPLWIDDRLGRAWVVTEFQYFEPPSCLDSEQLEKCRTEDGHLPASGYVSPCANNITGAILPDYRWAPPDPHSVLERALNIVRQQFIDAGIL